MPKVSIKPRPSEPPLPAFDERLRYRVEVASRFLGQSRAKTYNDLKAGTLVAIKDGARTFIPGTEIVRRSRAPSRAA